MVRNPTPICRIPVPEKMKDQSAIYPRVKVREEKDLDDHPVVFEQKRSYLLSLKDLESLFLQDSSNSPGKEHWVSPTPTAKIPKVYSTNVIKPSTSESQERCKKVDEDNKVNTRANSIPMPRAVVSSPGISYSVRLSLATVAMKIPFPQGNPRKLLIVNVDPLERMVRPTGEVVSCLRRLPRNKSP